MSDAKQQVMKLIANKQKRLSAIRKRDSKKVGLYSIVSDFIVAVEKMIDKTLDPLEWESTLNRELLILDKRLRTLDPQLERIELVWYKEEEAEKMEDLKLEGVKIYWSNFYLKNHPLELKEKYVDIMTLFANKYLSDMPTDPTAKMNDKTVSEEVS